MVEDDVSSAEREDGQEEKEAGNGEAGDGVEATVNPSVAFSLLGDEGRKASEENAGDAGREGKRGPS